MLRAEGPCDEQWDWGHTEPPSRPLAAHSPTRINEGKGAALESAQRTHQEPLSWQILEFCICATEPYVPEDLLLPLLEFAGC